MSQTTAGAGHGLTHRNNGATVLYGGPIASDGSDPVTQSPDITIMGADAGFYGSKVHDSNNTGAQSVLKTAATAIDGDIIQDGVTGFCRIEVTGHSFVVGQRIYVSGADVPAYNTTHTVTSVEDVNNVNTDVPFSANTSVDGDWQLASGDFAKMTADRYIMKRLASFVAGNAYSGLQSGAADGYGSRRSIHSIESQRRLDIVSWDYVTGFPTYGADRGALVGYENIDGGDFADHAAHPSRAVPGSLVYIDHSPAVSGDLAVAAQADYDAKTG